MRSDLIKPALFLSGIAVGVGVGYLLTKTHYRNLAEEEIASVREVYDTKKLEHEQRMEEKANINADGLAYLNKLEELQYNGVGGLVDPETNEEFIIPEMWSPSEEEGEDPTQWDREGLDHYVISVEEFMTENQYEHEKVTLVYYEGDDILVDDRNDQIPDRDNIIGEKTLEKFGFGANSEHIVYIHNVEMLTDFEITRDNRSYSQVVRGIPVWDVDDFDQRTPKVKKMRDDG